MPKSPFPHMLPHDVGLFAAFVLSEEGQQYEQWQFDFHLGPGTDPGPIYDPVMRQVATLLTQLRVDAIGWISGEPTIFEVKPDARLSAFGQLLAYCWFWHGQYGRPCHRGVITDSMTDQVRLLYEAHDISIHLVQETDSLGIQRAVNYVRPRTLT
jgi:hypothetical protein